MTKKEYKTLLVQNVTVWVKLYERIFNDSVLLTNATKIFFKIYHTFNSHTYLILCGYC